MFSYQIIRSFPNSIVFVHRDRLQQCQDLSVLNYMLFLYTWKFPLKLFHLYIETNKGCWTERILLLDVSWVKAGYYLKFEQTWLHLLLKRILPVFFSLWECSPWPISNVREVPSRLSMMSSVMGSDIYKLFKWLCRGREMPQGQHRSLMHTCAGKQGGENCYLPKTNIYQTLTPLESLQETG